MTKGEGYHPREFPEQSHEQKLRAQVEASDQELQRYAEGLEFGTPKFLGFADYVAHVKASANAHGLAAEKQRVVGGGQSEMSDYYRSLISEANRTLTDIELRSTDRENTVPGYLAAQEEFGELYSILYNNEKIRIKLDSEQEIVTLPGELREKPHAKLQLELQAQARLSIWRKLDDIRIDKIVQASTTPETPPSGKE